ncbi:MAG: capsule biosynthesis protein [Porticoccaceae bacterium]
MSEARHFLFLQGPISPFFPLLSKKLEAEGHKIFKINLNLGDQLHWKCANTTNYRGPLWRWDSWIEQFYRENRITDILLLGEKRDYHQSAIKIARRQNIQVVVTDFGYLRPDWITFELNGMSAESLFPRDPEEIMALADRCDARDMQKVYEDSFFNQAFWDVLYHFTAILGWVFFPGYDNFRRHNPVQDYFGILVRLLRRRWVEPQAKEFVDWISKSDIPYFVYPLQLQHDYSIQAYSPYDGNEQPMEDILRSFSRAAPKDTHLVVKIHPLDPSPFKWKHLVLSSAKRLGIKDRVHFLDGGNLHKLLYPAQGMVTINSTTAIATLQEGIATKILGSAMYDIEGLVSKQTLDEFWNDPEHPDVILRDAFIKALAGSIQLKGTYYRQPGLDNAVEEAAHRLLKNRINQPLGNLASGNSVSEL